MIFMSPRISGERSATAFGSLSAGSSTSLMPARFAPSTFSFTPPMGRITPESVISPVIASRSFTGRPVSKLTRAVTIAAHPSGFDEDDVASHRRPDESDGHAGPLDALLHFLLRAELRHAEQFPNDFRCDGHLVRLAFRDAPRLFARDGRNFTLEVAHARFPRIAVDDFLQSFVREVDLFAHL